MNRLSLVSVLFLSLISLPLSAESECPEIRKDHPRIMFNADTWPVLKARAEGPAKKSLAELLRRCDQMTSNPVAGDTQALKTKVVVQPDGSKITKAVSQRPIKEFGSEAAMCALAWRFTGDEKYLDKAKKMLKVSVDAYTEATKNGRAVAWQNTCRLNAICAYDWIYNDLTDEERAEIIVPLVEHVRLIQPEAGLKIPRNSSGSTRTGFYGTYALLWYSGLAADGDGYCDSLAHAQLCEGYRRFMDVIEYRNMTAGDDGALSTAAVNYSIGAYPSAHFNFFYSYESATGFNIASNYPNMSLFPYWVYWNWIRDLKRDDIIRYAGVGDVAHSRNCNPADKLYEHFSNYMYVFREINPEATAFTAALREFLPDKTVTFTYPATPFLIDTEAKADPELVKKLVHCDLKARHFETLGQVQMRSDWTPNSMYCTYVAGSNIHQHKHYDENSFVLYHYDYLALDSGDRGSEKDLNLKYYYAQTVAHNAVLIQKPGEKLPGHWGPSTDDPKANINYGGQVTHNPAKMLAFETNGDYTYVASDAAECYGEKCTEAVRQFVYIYPEYFVVYDRVGSSDPSYEKSWLLHMINQPTLKNGVLRTDSVDGRLFCQTFLPEKAQYDIIGGQDKEFWVRDRNYEQEK